MKIYFLLLLIVKVYEQQSIPPEPGGLPGVEGEVPHHVVDLWLAAGLHWNRGLGAKGHPDMVWHLKSCCRMALWFNRVTGSEKGVAQLLAHKVFSSTTLGF